MKERINIYLEGSFLDLITKLHYAKDIFKFMQFKHLNNDIRQWMSNERENYEIIDLYLEYVNTLAMSLGYFKNIASLDDGIELKGLLKKWFFYNDIEEEVKSSILYAISGFLQPTDKIFLEKVISEFYSYKNLNIANNIFKKASEGLNYLRDSESSKSSIKQFWVDTTNGIDEHATLMYNNAVFFSWTAKNTNEDVPNLAYANLITGKLSNKYIYYNKSFTLLNGKDVGCKLEYNIFKTEDKKIKINLLLLVGSKTYVKESDLNMISFLESISKLVNLTQTKCLQYYENNVVPKNTILEFKNNPHADALIVFTLQFLEIYEDFAISIHTKNIKNNTKLDSIELNGMFEELILHLSIIGYTLMRDKQQ